MSVCVEVTGIVIDMFSATLETADGSATSESERDGS